MRWNFIFLSLLIHAILILSLLIFNSSPNPLKPIVIDLQTDLQKVASSHSGHTKKQSSSHRTKRFFPALSYTSQLSSLGSQTTGSDQAADDWTSSWSYNQDGWSDYEGLNQHDIRFLSSLWNEIDKSIVNNPFLSEYGHIGKVYLKFEVDLDGQLIESSFKAHAEDNVLKVLAARAVRKVLKNETQELVFPKKKVLVQARFSWADYQACQQLRGTHKFFLSFCKYAEDKRKTFSTGEKIGTYLSAIPYGPGALEEIEKYNKEENRRNTQFDPFQSLRRDPDWNLGGS